MTVQFFVRYYAHQHIGEAHCSAIVTSTPAPNLTIVNESKRQHEPDLSEISNHGESTVSYVSGIEDINSETETASENEDTFKLDSQAKRIRVEKTMSQSFLDPFELSIDVTCDEVTSLDSADDTDMEDDPDYMPHFRIMLGPVNVDSIPLDSELLDLENSDNLERQEVEENSDSLERQEVDTVEDTDEEGSQTSLPRISTDEDIVNLLDGEFCLAFVNQLLELARERPSSQCKVGSCKSTPQIRTFYRGSALYLKWVCIV
ncbi:uncharacterized protein [Ptychodera flava]|uniref:uncharacterized protein isoform X2 n=1 Tax=Ptychodera flava TaxID=63121 RepID=UPI00396A504D